MNDPILVSFRLANSYLYQLMEDIPEDAMLKQEPGLRNHPTWILGHVLHSYQGIGEEIGLSPWLPRDWPALFGTGTIPQSDANMYPKKTELLGLLEKSEERLVNTISKMARDDFEHELPDVNYRKVLPTVGHAMVHILIGHTSIHIGQLTIWRSVMGLPRVLEEFDKPAD